ncbi:hypothetical protein [Lamprobacter modestohalophilus]|uniref:hypothetical protein n=1 Tax=Lamprobacter modestohalophilus TaxID=1064514 RepID=UPI002ADEA6D2|nr:hypothetical protein [Lamprobacter modestohalophilus]
MNARRYAEQTDVTRGTEMNKTSNAYRCGFRDGWNAYVIGCAQGLPLGMAEREPDYATGHDDGYARAEAMAENPLAGLLSTDSAEGATA